MRLIDADGLSKTIKETCLLAKPWDYVLIEQTIADAPTIEERKKGKWIHDGYDFPHGNDWIHCSECGKRGINVPADLTSFCSNCGADMRT